MRINIRIEKRYTGKDGRQRLKLAVHRDGRTLYSSLDFYVLPEEWDEKGQRILGTKNRAVNALLQRNKAEMESRLLLLQDKGLSRTLNDKQLVNYITGVDNEEKPHYFKQMMEEYASVKTNRRTKEIYDATVRKLVQFCDYEHITFEEMNVSWLRSFDAWLSETEKSANTRSIHLRNIRTIFNAALDDELITVYPFRRFKIAQEETEKRSIPVEEMRRLFHCQVEPFQEKYRDCFFLQFYLVGINTVDLAALSQNAIQGGRIRYKRSKTGKLYNIKVESEAAEILQRYQGETHLLSWFDNRKDYRTFVMHYDKNLQRIAKENALPPITSYVARHSWASYASELDIPKDVISHALGHHTTVTDTYIRFNLDKVDAANRKVIDYLLD